MGTNAVYGIRKNGKRKLTYVHLDGYPDCLGEEVVEYLRKTSIKELTDIFNNLKPSLYNENSITMLWIDQKLTKQEQQQIMEHILCDFNVNEDDISNIDFDDIINTSREAWKEDEEDDYKFRFRHHIDSLNIGLCWEYIIDLDTNQLEINDCNSDNDCMFKYDLNNIPENWLNDFEYLNHEYDEDEEDIKYDES